MKAAERNPSGMRGPRQATYFSPPRLPILMLKHELVIRSGSSTTASHFFITRRRSWRNLGIRMYVVKLDSPPLLVRPMLPTD